jgi:hypothetical protein
VWLIDQVCPARILAGCAHRRGSRRRDRSRRTRRRPGRRVQVRLYADPRQPQTGIEVALAGEKAPDGVTFMGERAPFHRLDVEWICAPTDGVCAAHEPLGPQTFVGYLATHTSYR